MSQKRTFFGDMTKDQFVQAVSIAFELPLAAARHKVESNAMNTLNRLADKCFPPARVLKMLEEDPVALKAEAQQYARRQELLAIFYNP